ncbi:MAG TPA: FAD-binding oxidoreductase, partial [Chitinophagaceae bacterium]|nr:FAD-binding oxidoreductase [Chitinophagaceae bacterium]
MHCDYLIIGQGIAGTFMGWYLERAGASCAVIDESKSNTASKVAAGLINPVTGRRLVKSWMIDELLPFAWQAYKDIGDDLNIDCIRQTSILNFFQAPDMQDAFNKKFQEDHSYLARGNGDDWREFFDYPFSYGIIDPCYVADTNKLMTAYCEKLSAKGNLIDEKFDSTQLIIKQEGIQYKNIEAKKIIFCDGAAGFDNPWFAKLPYALNKGEALIVKVPGLPAEQVYKFGFILIPMDAAQSLFWFGSGNDWMYTDDQPSEKFRQLAEAELKRMLKLPFSIMEQKAAIRPANIERRPFCGLHPAYPQIAILNGLGTKGCSLAPYFANQLARHLLLNEPILPAVDVKRFERMLG